MGVVRGSQPQVATRVLPHQHSVSVQQGLCMTCHHVGIVQVILSVAEHHSNLVPWQLVAQKTGAVLKHVRLTQDIQELDMQVNQQQDTETVCHMHKTVASDVWHMHKTVALVVYQ